MTESETQAQILAAIGAAPGCLVERSNTGAAAARSGRVVRFGTRGAPDIRVTVQGRSVAIEVKSAVGRLSNAQKRWRTAFELAGGVYIVARDVAWPLSVLAGLASGETRAYFASALNRL